VGVSEQQWFFRSVGMNVCESEAEALHCNRDNGIVSLRPSIDTIVITTKSRPSPITHLSNPSAPNLIGRSETNTSSPRATSVPHPCETNTLPAAQPLIFFDPTHTKSETSSPSKIYRLSSQNA
jgi:hypothetical protein